MAGRIFSARLLRSLEKRVAVHSATTPLRASSVLLSHPHLTNLLSSHFSSGRSSSNPARKEKSLIEDEGELSEWISDLKTDLVRFPLHSDSEDESSRRSGRGTGRFKERGNFRAEERNSRGSRGLVKKQRGFYNDRYGGGGDDDERGHSEGLPPWRERGGRGRGGMSGARGGGRGEGFSSWREKGGRGSKDDMSGAGGGARGKGFCGRSGGGRNHMDDDDDDEGDYSEGFPPWRERGGRGRGVMSGPRLGGSRGKGFGGRSGGGKDDVDFDFSDEERGSRGGGRMTDGGSGRSERLRGGKRGQKGRGFDSNLTDEETADESDAEFSSGKKGRGVCMSVRQRGGKTSQGGKDVAFDLSEEETGSDSDEGFSDYEEVLSRGKKDKMKDDFVGGDSGLDLGSEKLDAGEEDENIVRDTAGENDSYLSQKRFNECSLSQLTLKGLKSAGYERMSIVQEATLPIIPKGNDVLAKAKTRTGKTVAFLARVPAIETVMALPPVVDRDKRMHPINVLVVCPTPELADQAAQEAIKLVKYHASIGVQLVIGGTRLALEQKRMQTNPCQILMATPGRLRDHMENMPGFATRLRGVKSWPMPPKSRPKPPKSWPKTRKPWPKLSGNLLRHC